MVVASSDREWATIHRGIAGIKLKIGKLGADISSKSRRFALTV
jgi:hypothetical protein